MHYLNSLQADTAVVFNVKAMDDTERPRSIRLPQWLWDELDRDAVRCKRSSVKQLEVVLTAYYRSDNTGLNTEALSNMKNDDANGVPVGRLKLNSKRKESKTG